MTVDWTAIERSPEFRELSQGRRRYAMRAGAIGLGIGAAYVVTANLARDLMGTEVLGAMSLGFLGGVGLIVMTWVITFMYLRRSKRVWMPLEERVRQLAVARDVAAEEPRFVRADPGAAPVDGAVATDGEVRR